MKLAIRNMRCIRSFDSGDLFSKTESADKELFAEAGKTDSCQP
jgi:hypothetical protein